MSISDLICEVYRWPRPNQIANGSMTYGDGVMLLLRVLTDDGREGQGWLGERPPSALSKSSHPTSHSTVTDSSGAIPKTAPPYTPISNANTSRLSDSAAPTASSPVQSTALWDLRGRIADKPVHALLAGDDTSKKVRGYIAGGYYYGDDGTPDGLKRLQDELSSNVQDLRARSVKIKIGAPDVGIDIDTRRVAASRETIGPDIELMVDANCAFKDVATCVAYAKTFEPYDIFWFEEPFRPDAFDLYHEFVAATSIPIATGENISTVPHFRELIRQGSVHWINADVAILTGGYDGGTDIWAIANEAGCHLAPHGCQELQCHYVAAADPAGGRLEIYPPMLDPECDRIFPIPFALDGDGMATIPDIPGVGLLPDRNALEPHLVYTSHP
jgi:L-alanine-DL-glutamate epimerase-like enolase superfamily enzyme